MNRKIVQITAIDTSQEKLLKKLNIESKKQGYQVHCIASKADSYKEIEKDGLIFHDVKIERSISLMSNFKSLIAMYKILRIIRPEIVHVHTPIAAVLGRIAAKVAKVPTIIYTAHGFYFHDNMSKKKYFLFFNIEKYVGRYFTDYIFTQSKEDYDLAVKNKFLKNQDNYRWISNGIDLEEKFNYTKIKRSNIKTLKSKHDIKENDLIISFIGRLVEEKGIIELLTAAKQLNRNIKFFIIGSLLDSDRDTNTIDFIEKFKNEEHIIFTGQVPNINELLYLSDIFCLPSYREGMPRSIIEAMSMKNAILATNIRGSREEVIHGQNGFLFNTRDVNSIVKYILQLQQDRKLLNEMKEKSYKRAFELYNESEVVKKQIEVFEKVVRR